LLLSFSFYPSPPPPDLPSFPTRRSSDLGQPMSAIVRMTTTVLPGHKIEITAPELPVGRTVEVTVTVPAPTPPAAEGKGILDFIKDRKSTRLNSSLLVISYAVFCLKKKNK